MVSPAGQIADFFHVVFNDLGNLCIVDVCSFTALEIDVGILRGTGLMGMLGVECTLTETLNGIVIEQLCHILVFDLFDLLNLMRGAEAVEEVQEGDSALDGGKVSYGSEVHDLLHVALAEHCKAGLTAGHDVGMVAEDAEGVGSQSAGGDVENAGEQLACDLVHVGDHEQQTLGSGVGGGESARVQRAVDRAGCAGLSLHLLHLDGAAEDVLLTLGRPLVDKVRHGARGGDGVDRGDFGERVAYVRGRLVAVHRLVFSCHIFSSVCFFLCFESNTLKLNCKHQNPANDALNYACAF